MSRDPIDRLRDIGPHPEDLTDDDLAPARRRFTELTGIDVDAAADSSGPVHGLPRPNSGGRRWWFAAAAAAAALVMLAAGLAIASRDDTARTATSTPGTGPVRTWAGLIDLVASQPDQSGHPGLQYVRWEAINRAVVGTNPDGSQRWANNPYLSELWIASDATVYETRDNMLGPGETLPAFTSVSQTTGTPPNAMTAPELAGLARDPATLRRQLKEKFDQAGGTDADHDALGIDVALELLTQPGTPPDLQKAILQLLAADPSFVESSSPGSGTVTGEITLLDTRHVLDFDAATGRVRSWRELAADADPLQGLGAGEEKAYRKNLRYGFVDQPGQRP